MRIDRSLSKYHEHPDVAAGQFNVLELRRLRTLMRRMQFLEQKVRESGGMTAPDANGGAMYAEYEMEALEYVLTEVGYLEEVVQ